VAVGVVYGGTRFVWLNQVPPLGLAVRQRERTSRRVLCQSDGALSAGIPGRRDGGDDSSNIGKGPRPLSKVAHVA